MCVSGEKIPQAEIDKFMNISKSEADDSQRCRDIIGQLQAELGCLKETMKDIRGREREIKYHHTKPRASRHGNTTHICLDIESRIEAVLTGGQNEVD